MLSRLRLKKALALFLLISFIPLTLQAQEQRGRYTRLLEGNSSPFDAWCFDDPALAIMKAKFDTMQETCDLAISL